MLHGRSAPPGLERAVLRSLPGAFGLGVGLLLAMVLGVRLFPPAGTAVDVAKATRLTDYVAIAAGLTLVTAVATVALGCVIVAIMKGPAYVADAYWPEEPPAG